LAKTRILLLLSGGIDSPVAGYLLGKQPQLEVEAIFFQGYPFLPKEEVERVLAVCRQLKKHANLTRLHLVPHGGNLQEFLKTGSPNYVCVLCKRFMLRVASQLALKEGCEALATGDSLGQVASQTLANLKVEDEASLLPVLRPLLGLNKEEIVSLARHIGTYPISASNPASCKAAPKKPATKASLEKVKELEGKLPLNQMVSRTLAERRTLKV